MKTYILSIFTKYHLGIVLLDQDVPNILVFCHFLPKIIVIYSILDQMTKLKLLDLHEQQECYKETIYQAYDRYIENKFNKKLFKILNYDSDSFSVIRRTTQIVEVNYLKRRAKSCDKFDRLQF